MKIIKKSNNVLAIKMSKKEWEDIGNKKHWNIVEAKKKKDNSPYAICTKSIGKTEGTTKRNEWSEDAEKRYERCKEKIEKNK